MELQGHKELDPARRFTVVFDPRTPPSDGGPDLCVIVYDRYGGGAKLVDRDQWTVYARCGLDNDEAVCCALNSSSARSRRHDP